MNSPVNLNRARKQRARDEARRQAEMKAARFGRSKAEKSAEDAKRGAEDRKLNSHRRETE